MIGAHDGQALVWTLKPNAQVDRFGYHAIKRGKCMGGVLLYWLDRI